MESVCRKVLATIPYTCALANEPGRIHYLSDRFPITAIWLEFFLAQFSFFLRTKNRCGSPKAFVFVFGCAALFTVFCLLIVEQETTFSNLGASKTAYRIMMTMLPTSNFPPNIAIGQPN